MGQLLGEKQQVFDAGKRIELARAAASGPKAVGQLDDTQWPHRGSENVDQDLCANPREAWRNLVDKRAAQDKKTADRVGDIGLDQAPREAGAVNAEPLAPVGRQPFRAAGFDIAAGDDDIGGIVLERIMHARQQGFIVLQVAVDDRDERRRGRQHAFDAGRAQPPSSDAPDAADARVALAERADVLGGAVGRIVIDKHDLPGDAA